MIIRLILIVAVLTILFTAYQKLLKASPKQRKGLLISYAIYGIIGLVLIAFFTGKLHWLGAVAAGAVGVLRVGLPRLLRLLPMMSFLGRNQPFGNPVFNTEYLKIQLDVSTGAVSGQVKKGLFEDSELEALSSGQLDELEALYAKEHKRSFYLLRVYRQKKTGFKNQYNDQSNNEKTAQSTSMSGTLSYDEALQILGVENTTKKADIEKAYKRLIQKLHPDRGGNDYLASRINLARDIILAKHKN